MPLQQFDHVLVVLLGRLTCVRSWATRCQRFHVRERRLWLRLVDQIEAKYITAGH